MTDDDRKRLRELAEVCASGMMTVADEEEFTIAANPQTVIALLDDNEQLRAQLDATRAEIGAECIEHVELNGHIEIATQAYDYLNSESLNDPSGKLRDFVESVGIVIAQLDRQRRRANWHEAAYDAGKAKLIETAVDRATANLHARCDILEQEIRERERAAEVSAKLLTDQRDEARAELEQLQPILSVLGDWDWPAIANDVVPDAAVDAVVRALAYIAKERR